MTIGEALNHRADLQKRIAQVRERLCASVLAQEGEEPPERPQELLEELDSLCAELQALIAQINHANATTTLPDGETVTAALARRDVLDLRLAALRAMVKEATGGGPFSRYSRSEIRMVRQIEVGEIQRQVDLLAKQRRELDTLLQAHNWSTPMGG
jgi:Family of unknown function (DUF6847)